MGGSWFGATLLCYLGASLAYHFHLFTGSQRAGMVARVLVPCGLALHTTAIGVFCSSQGSLLADPGAPASLVAYFLAVLQIGANLKSRWVALGSLTLPLAFVAEFYATLLSGPTEAGAASTPWPLRSPHVMALILGFAAFTAAFALAVAYLAQSRWLKRKQSSGLLSRLPPLESVSSAAHLLAIGGFSLLTLGMITGALAAPEKWGPQWYLDPRTVSSLVAWLTYAAYLTTSLVLRWRGRRTTYFLIAGYLLVVIAFAASVGRGSG